MQDKHISCNFELSFRSTYPDMKRIHRELASLMKNVDSQFDGQVTVDATDLEENLSIKIVINPNAGKSFDY